MGLNVLVEHCLKNRGTKHTQLVGTLSVKQPAFHSAAENFVKSFKKKFEVLRQNGMNIKDAIKMFLFDYRATKHSITGESPAKLILNRKLRTTSDLLRPDIGSKVHIELNQQIKNKREKRQVQFEVREEVRARNCSGYESHWTEAIITKTLGPVSSYLHIY